MKYQDYIVPSIQHAFDEAFRYAKAVPADKLEWKPLDTGRSVSTSAKNLPNRQGM